MHINRLVILDPIITNDHRVVLHFFLQQHHYKNIYEQIIFHLHITTYNNILCLKLSLNQNVWELVMISLSSSLCKETHQSELITTISNRPKRDTFIYNKIWLGQYSHTNHTCWHGQYSHSHHMLTHNNQLWWCWWPSLIGGVADYSISSNTVDHVPNPKSCLRNICCHELVDGAVNKDQCLHWNKPDSSHPNTTHLPQPSLTLTCHTHQLATTFPSPTHHTPTTLTLATLPPSTFHSQ